MADFSVIILNYNTRHLMLDYLYSVIATTRGMPVETWVVDKTSTDGGVVIALSFCPDEHALVQ